MPCVVISTDEDPSDLQKNIFISFFSNPGGSQKGNMLGLDSLVTAITARCFPFRSVKSTSAEHRLLYIPLGLRNNSLSGRGGSAMESDYGSVSFILAEKPPQPPGPSEIIEDPDIALVFLDFAPDSCEVTILVQISLAISANENRCLFLTFDLTPLSSTYASRFLPIYGLARSRVYSQSLDSYATYDLWWGPQSCVHGLPSEHLSMFPYSVAFSVAPYKSLESLPPNGAIWSGKLGGSASQFIVNDVNGSGSRVMANGVTGSIPSVIANGVDWFVSEVMVNGVSGSVPGVVVNGVVGNGVGGFATEVINDGVSVIANEVGGLVSEVQADGVIASGVGGSIGPGISNGVSGSVASVTQVDKDHLLGYFNQEVREDIARLREYMAIASGLRITVRRRRERICRLKALGNCQDAIDTIRFWERMQLDDVEKGTRALLMMRESEAKIREKAGFILNLRNVVCFYGLFMNVKDVSMLMDLDDVAAAEDGSLAREINGLYDGLTARIEEREYFIYELDTLVDIFVLDKMAEFLKKTQDKDRNSVNVYTKIVTKMEGLPMCAELEMAVGSRRWLNMMVLYYRKLASEDQEVALRFNRLRGDRNVAFEDKMDFVQELESVMGVSVVAKTAVFLKEMMEKEDSREYHLENLENETKQRALEMESFVQKLMRDGS
ncbi:hypothetical protein Tco_0001742 [Tanacetum coccineum]